VLRGASSHILEEADRSLHDALCVLSETVKEPRVLYGGGWPEMRMARAIEEAAKKTPGAWTCWCNTRGCFRLLSMPWWLPWCHQWFLWLGVGLPPTFDHVLAHRWHGAS
jgi:hypothetical protein